MQDNLLDPFLKNNYSVYQIRNRFNVLKNYLSDTLFNAQRTTPLTQADQEWINSLGPEYLAMFTPLNINQMLSEIDKKLRNIQPLTIYLAFDLPEDELNKLGVWIRTNISANIVLEIKFDGNLIAGSALSFKGIYKDYSVRSMIEKDKESIIQSMKKFLK